MSSQVLYNSPTEAVAVTNVAFLNLNGVAADPTSVSLVLTDPTGTITNFTYVAGPGGINLITKQAGTGNYSLTIDNISVPGLYTYVWIGSGNNVQQVTPGTFRLVPLSNVGYGMQYWYTGMEELKSRLNLLPGDKNYNSFNYEMQLAIHCVANWINQYCLVADTPVLTADLRWVPVGSLEIGDELVGVDEYGTGKRPKRHYRRAQVTANPRRLAQCTKITLEDGRIVTSADDHRWLVRTNYGKNGAVYDWAHASQVKPGYEISAPFDGPWPEETDFESGWMSGILDGEGSLHRARGNHAGSTVTVSQNAGPVLSRMETWLKEHGIPYAYGDAEKCKRLDIGTRAASMEVLGRLQPVRLMPRSHEVWEDGQVTGSVRVIAVEDAGVREVVSLGTSTGTFIANGLVSHNCGRHFYQLQEARTYQPNEIWELPIDDIAPATAGTTTVAVDYDGDGIYETNWGTPAPPLGSNTSFNFYTLKLGDPRNYEDNFNPNAYGGVARPYRQLQALMIPSAVGTNGAWIPFVWPYSHLNRVQITATWGWDYVPPEVQQASLMLCTDIYKSRETPWGLAGTNETGLVKVSSNPWVVELLRPYINFRRKAGV